MVEEDSALVFKRVSFRYRAQAEPTLIDINLRVDRGEKILILGPSGSGKSTLLHCINGIIPHAFKGERTGEILLLGRDIGDYGIFDISKMAGTVLQDTDSQFVGLSAAEDIAFAMENDSVPAEEMRRRVTETAALVSMGTHLGKSPQDLSGGQKQRISMAGVLVDNVELLLFDEPLANLDPAAGKDAIELIDELHKKTGKTVLIVEHRLEDVLHCPVDRIVVMDKGRIIADKKPAELLASGLLKKTGIREPLYLSALAYSGITIDSGMSPEHPNTLKLDYRPFAEWDRQLAAEQNAGTPGAAEPGAGNIRSGLEIQNLHFRYAGQDGEALKGISFSVAPGECVGLVGRNGSGKSTLAKCVCGFVRPDSGEIYFNGSDLAALSIMERAEQIGYVMQNPNQMICFPAVYDEIAFGLRNRGVPETEIKARVYEALEVCGLFPFRNWPVNALSYGQKKRLTVASILVLRPSFMILDEPTAGQDYRHYTEFMEFLFGLNRDLKISLLLITHDMHLMLEYTGRAVVLSEGICVADREPFEVLTDDGIIEQASLKRTSLYALALNAGLPDPRGFVGRFIAYDRKKRESHGKGNNAEKDGT
ncbi:MAG: ABC transporter ATP-binding protein [Spirochaetaceae bacterium]|jgi:energy-coupling factor transport system ATP-binding protein|nr:ABC transporter ATP-binding protein [Spirochaetaceae bacterium]